MSNLSTGVSVERYHWLNTIVGILDSAFYLTEEEQYQTSIIVGKLLEVLNIPDRSQAQVLPMPVVQEMYSSYYTVQLQTALSGVIRTPRVSTEYDCNTSLESWVSALSSMISVSYPDIDAEHRVLIKKVFSDLLAQLGVPDRAAAFFPAAVLKVHRDIEDN